MKTKLLSSILLAGISFSIATANEIAVIKGWDLKGASSDITVAETFNDPAIKTIWTWDAQNKLWKAYSPDSTLADVIESDTNIGSLVTINKNDGYWINSEYSTILNMESNITDDNITDDNTTDDNITMPDNNLNFIDPLQDVLVSDVANKSFKLYNYSTQSYETITFDANGVATTTETDCAGNNFTYTAKVEDGKLNIYESNELEGWYKILAKDNVGIVFGGQEKYFDGYSSSEYLETETMYVLNTTSVETPVNMSLKLPYTFFQSYQYSAEHANVYESNMTVASLNYDYSTNSYEKYYNNDNPFTINSSGAIEEMYSYTSDTYSHSEGRTVQVVASIGRYDIVASNHSGSYSEVNTEIPTNATWTDILSTFGEYQGYVFDTTNNTFTPSYTQEYFLSGTYSISGNVLTLNFKESYDSMDEVHCYSQTYTLDAAKQTITTDYSYSGDREVASSSTIYSPETTTYYRPMARTTSDKKPSFDLILDKIRSFNIK